MSASDSIRTLFRSPTAEYRTAPLWVWNAEMSRAQIDRHLLELKTHGFGGAFVHPRPGMRITYLDDQWFDAWGYALQKAKELGLKLNIYDENSYPSGFGGGHVSAELPDCLAESVSYEIVPASEIDFSDPAAGFMGDCSLVSAFACDRKNGVPVFLEDVTDLPQSMWKGKGPYFAIVKHIPARTTGWLAGFANVDLLRPEVTEKFLELVYDRYADRFQKDFGDTIRAVFTDEPALSGSNVYDMTGIPSLPVTRWFCYEFQKIAGYDLTRYIPCLFENWEGMDCPKIRFDYYRVTQQLWTENFLTPIRDWCHEKKIRFTGHFMDDGWPLPYYIVVTPGTMSYYEYEDWPGIDLLQCDRLRERPVEDQHIFMLECASVGHQFGKERIFCEAYGAGGYDSGLADYKRMGDYLFVSGINYINEHLSYTSYIGARKRDHPQSFDWRQPWWNDYTELNDYFGRLSAALSQGYTEERILVIDPTTTGYLYPRTKDMSQLDQNRPAHVPMAEEFLQMLEDLRRYQYDFSLGDEEILRRHGKIGQGRLQIVKENYEIIILHACTANLLESTAGLLKNFVSRGGMLLCCGTPGDRISGAAHPEIYEELLSSDRCIVFATEAEMLRWLEKNYPRHFTFDREMPEGVESISRQIDDHRTLYFIVNHSKKDISAAAEFHGQAVEKWDPWTGDVMPAACSRNKDILQIPLALRDNESVLLCVSDAVIEDEEAGNPDVRPAAGCAADPAGDPDADQNADPASSHSETLEFTSIEPESENVWPLEFCSLTIDGEKHAPMPVTAVCQSVYKKRGFKADPWDNVVQYKNRTYEQNRFYGKDSGFTLEYCFRIQEGFQPQQLQLAVENGKRYSIRINGQKCETICDTYFLEDAVSSFDISGLVHSGLNSVALVLKTFDVEMEPDLITLRGAFGVFEEDGHWVMGPQKKLHTGNWIPQGYPFYCGAMLYHAELAYRGEKKVSIHVPEQETTALSVSVNGRSCGCLNLNGCKGKDITKQLQVGKNSITLRLCASLKNYFGPHFDPDHPRKKAWPQMWRQYMSAEPAASDYDLIPYGLEGTAEIEKAYPMQLNLPGTIQYQGRNL